jgi:hypothetical protein
VLTPDVAPENPQLLSHRHVLERDDSMTTTDQPERSKQDDKSGQHALSCRPIDLRINRWGWRSGVGEPHRAIKDMVTALEYRHVQTGTLAILAQRLGKVWASPST